MSTAQAALQLVATAVAAGVVVAGCQHPAPRGAPTSGLQVGASVIAAPAASAPPQPVPPSSAAPPVTNSIAADASIPCGRGSCPAATQICCGHVPKERGTCLDYTGDRTDISALGRACQGIDDERYPLVCDDSGDCPAGHTCCDELGGDPDYHICTPLLCRLVETVPPAVPPRALPNG